MQLKFRCDDEQLDTVLPSKGGEFAVAALAAPLRGKVYTLDGVPLLVDTTAKGDYIPTIYALWKAPSLLPTVTLKHAAVSQFLIGAL